jgi:hypothetical protein
MVSIMVVSDRFIIIDVSDRVVSLPVVSVVSIPLPPVPPVLPIDCAEASEGATTIAAMAMSLLIIYASCACTSE